MILIILSILFILILFGIIFRKKKQISLKNLYYSNIKFNLRNVKYIEFIIDIPIDWYDENDSKEVLLIGNFGINDPNFAEFSISLGYSKIDNEIKNYILFSQRGFGLHTIESFKYYFYYSNPFKFQLNFKSNNVLFSNLNHLKNIIFNSKFENNQFFNVVLGQTIFGTNINNKIKIKKINCV